jgi:DNA-binding IclR family transcriptional regulator
MDDRPHVARGTGISPSTCFNILRTLTRARFVAFRSADKTYSLGLAVAELAAGLIGVSHAELIRPELERLALNHDMLIVLWRVTEDGHIVLIDRAHSHTAVRVEMQMGLRLPMLVGAIGRCTAAALNLPLAELRRRFATLRWQSPPGFDAYLADVEKAREQGWSIDIGNLYRGLITVAALVTDQNGLPRFGVSGITISGQHAPETLERLGRDLQDVAAFTGAALFPHRHAGS